MLQFGDDRAKAVAPESKFKTILVDLDSFDKELDDAVLLQGKQLVPDRVDLPKGIDDVLLRDGMGLQGTDLSDGLVESRLHVIDVRETRVSDRVRRATTKDVFSTGSGQVPVHRERSLLTVAVPERAGARFNFSTSPVDLPTESEDSSFVQSRSPPRT